MKILILLASLVLISGIFIISQQYSGEREFTNEFTSRQAAPVDLGINKKISLENFKGNVKVLYFGFTYCPDVCPTSINFITKVFKKINNPNVSFIFVSVDHKRDTEEKVQDYVSYYNQKFIGTTGTKKQIDTITKDYNIFYRFINLPKSHMKYTVDHTSRFIVIDKYDQWVDSIHSESTIENAIMRINKHL